MSTAERGEGLTRLSLLDRLIDDDPDVSEEVPMSKMERARRAQDAIRRDLQDLLNTRYRCVAWPPQLDELEDSLINYGIPDFTAAGLDLATEEETLLDSVKHAIQTFEPRLTEVSVLSAGSGHYDRVLRFRIEATLLLENERLPLRYETRMESSTGQFEVGDRS